MAEPSQDLEAMQAHMVNQFAKFVSMIPYLPDELQVVVMNIKDPGKVTDLIASNLNISLEEKQDLLEHARRARAAREALDDPESRDRAARARPQDPVAGADRSSTRTSSEFYLREQMKAIQKELGEGDDARARARGAAREDRGAELPEERSRRRPTASSSACKMHPAESAEYTVVAHLPRVARRPAVAKSTEDNLDIQHAREVLDEDHYGLEKIKDASSSTSRCAS